ncbi:MAG: hypothetical protein IH991_15040 [Planctomycetes bacterium]|nr:hypothetical protein [Planctomycetota bacterium]
MDIPSLYLPFAGILIILLGVGCGVGGVVLWHGKPKSWKDVVAPENIVHRTSRALAGMSVLLLVPGVTTLLRVPWGCVFGAISTLLFVVAGFWGNYALFGDLRPKHTGTNVIVACTIWLLIWLDFPG